MTVTPEIAQRLNIMGYPEIIYVGATSGQWPKETFIDERMAADWLAGHDRDQRRRYMIRVNLHTGEVTEVTLKEQIIERSLETVEPK